MGIQNLLQELKPITKHADLSEFSGQTCGVDASCWLHRAAYSCALQLISGKNTTKYLHFTLNCLNLLKCFNVTPIIVFDGAHLPMKANEEHRRNTLRDKNKKDALRFLSCGDRENAWKSAQKAVHITKNMITSFMNQCIEHCIQFIVAPYEADSQLGFMYKHKQIDFVISEDSDLLLFGVRRALYKFDPKKASGQFVDLELIKYYTQTTQKKRKMDLCWFLKKFWFETENNDGHKNNLKEKEFINVCVLSGCDYVDNLPGIGLKTAVKQCTEYRKIQHLLSVLMMRNNCKAPKDYKIQFNRAILTFRHQTVYDIEEKKQKHLNPLTQSVETYLTELKRYLNRLKPKQNNNNNNDKDKNPAVYDTTLDFLGKMVDDHTATLIAEGKINARSLKPRNLNKLKENISDESNRNRNTSINVFQQKTKDNRKGKSVRVKRNMTKESKYFGGNNNENTDNTTLNTFFTQFGYDKDTDNDKDYNWKQIEDIKREMMDFEEKDEIDDVISDCINEEHKPLRKRNRKRKRSVFEDEEPLKSIANANGNGNGNTKRRLNNDIDMKTPVPKSKFITRITPRNVEQSMDKSTCSLMSDLYCSSSHKSNKKRARIVDKENIGFKGNNNPFSVNREKKTMSVIRDNGMDLSESETDLNDGLYKDLYGDEEEQVEDGIYSQLSQSQSEQQMHDIADRFKRSQSEWSEERKNDDMDDDDDDDITIMNDRKMDKKEIKVQCKGFKKPRFNNGGPPIIRNESDSKKRVNSRKSKCETEGKLKKNNRNKKGNNTKQRTITSFFKK